MRSVSLGSQGMRVSRIGLGCMGMSQFYGELPTFAQCQRVLDRAVELGITLFDTADIYGAAGALFGAAGPGFGHNEELLGRALQHHGSKVSVATRFGAYLNEAGHVAITGRPDYVRSACEASLKRLGLDVIDLYMYARLDPAVPIEETVGAMGDLVKAGKVRYIGVSEMDGGILRRAHGVHPLTALESELSLWTRNHEQGVLRECKALGIGFLAFSPLGRAMLTGVVNASTQFGAADFRKHLPKFSEESIEQNLGLVAQLRELAEARGCPPGQIALAWVLSRGEHVVPIPGTKQVHYLEQNAAAAELVLTEAEVAALDRIFDPANVAGERTYTGTSARRAAPE